MSLDITPTAFWYLRHGETDWNAQNLSQGNVDIPLNPTGIAQAHVAAERLRHRGITTILASPLSRARDTAQIVADVLGLELQFDEGLREVSFGVQEGQPMGEWFSEWIEGVMTPQGGETFAALRARGVAAINRALVHPAPVLVVAHGALFRGLRQAMGLGAGVRTPNGTPYWCDPGNPAWTVTEAG